MGKGRSRVGKRGRRGGEKEVLGVKEEESLRREHEE